MTTKDRTNTALAGPILCYGFASAVAMWIVGFATHHPAVHVHPMVAGLLMVFTLLAACIFAGGGVAAEGRRSWIVGLGSGALAAVLTLLILGSYLVEKDANGKVDFTTLAMEAGGFVLLGAGVGLVGGLMGALLERIFSAKRKELIVPAGEPDWLARFGIVAACAVVPLLVIGGWTTTAGAALSVPDWPGTYAANMFLYPIGLMTRPRVFLEHSHRLFGALIGLTTLTLMLFTFFSGERRRWMKIWIVIIFALVVVQGVLGGLRVTQQSTGLALLHGILAQLFFALLVAYAACLSPMFKNADLARGVVVSRRPKIMATAFLHTTIMQLVFGAMYRHMGSPHAMYTHIVFSLFVVITAVFAAFELRTMLSRQDDPQWARPRRAMNALGAAILVCVTLQFALGWAALFIVGIKKGKPELPFAEDAVHAAEKTLAQQSIPTIHQANGALLLAVATLGYVWVRRFWKRAPRA
jgi:cytochrome c oxidase assembly protein subunit 15